MKKELKGFIIGLIVSAFAVSGMAYAKTGTEMIEAAYNNVKIYIDGVLLDPKDADGNTVEPFVSNGTTYLPVRAIANAFGKDVNWDADTSSVILGSRNYDWLDQMSFLDSETTGSENKFYSISSETRLSDDTICNRGLRFEIDEYHATVTNDDGTTDCYVDISYSLNNQYESFEGIISAVEAAYDEKSTALIKIYGDDELLYSSPIISRGMKSTDFKIDVSGVNVLKINTACYNPNGYTHLYPCIAEARLLKK